MSTVQYDSVCFCFFPFFAVFSCSVVALSRPLVFLFFVVVFLFATPLSLVSNKVRISYISYSKKVIVQIFNCIPAVVNFREFIRKAHVKNCQEDLSFSILENANTTWKVMISSELILIWMLYIMLWPITFFLIVPCDFIIIQ